jgi:hypothetical protein
MTSGSEPPRIATRRERDEDHGQGEPDRDEEGHD